MELTIILELQNSSSFHSLYKKLLKFHPMGCFRALSPLSFIKIHLNRAAIDVNRDMSKSSILQKTKSKILSKSNKSFNSNLAEMRHISNLTEKNFPNGNNLKSSDQSVR
jgi:hypothetical protein